MFEGFTTCDPGESGDPAPATVERVTRWGAYIRALAGTGFPLSREAENCRNRIDQAIRERTLIASGRCMCQRSQHSSHAFQIRQLIGSNSVTLDDPGGVVIGQPRTA